MVRRHPTRGLVYSVVVMAVAGGIVGAVLHRSVAPHPVAALSDYGALPDFLLTDHRRQPISRSQLAGSVWVADFIFTRCAGQCPMMSTQLAALQKAFAGAAGIQFISFTVDPEHDTPEALAEYAAHYAAEANQWRLVTGSKQALHTLAQAGFHLGVGEEGSRVEPITHSVRFVLVDQAGHLRGYYDATDAGAMRQLAQDARRLLAAE